ncbi:hypothetical protein HYG77_31295 (plasmid) [Rhodococcus sp. ZPP]|uniref:hypothetical protein n=1 Tax=Rhodococcus sp. ZPP TaxID=2749906 RepID=UPI001AD8660A|nr:hypothetical protein [Rhodococcus sp. ZPP]QTJ70096.1 hypothetical protein HYG77_31295 [Rhodococcus sp. ZPP]
MVGIFDDVSGTAGDCTVAGISVTIKFVTAVRSQGAVFATPAVSRGYASLTFVVAPSV